MKLKVKTNSSSSVLVGPLFGSSGTGPVTVGNTAAPVAAPAPVAPKKSEPMLNDTESYFNKAIKDAVAKGDVDKALKLLDEAERLGSTSARSTFISSKRQGVIVSHSADFAATGASPGAPFCHFMRIVIFCCATDHLIVIAPP